MAAILSQSQYANSVCIPHSIALIFLLNYYVTYMMFASLYPYKEINFKILSAKWQPFCLGLKLLSPSDAYMHQ